MTWVVDQVEVLPLLIITAPEKACGKSQLLDIIALMAARSLSVSNISQAALYRCIEKAQPSLLIDEVDTFIRDKPEMMGIINAGHTRGSAHVIRSVGDMHEPKKFSVWCPKVLAGIALERHLKDATLSRGIVITMQRKLPGDRVQRLRHASRDRFTEIRRKCARFAQDSASMLAGARPILPEQLNDRQQDNWEPLLAIAGLAGSEWAQKANQAALAISEIDTEESIGVQLLSAIRSVFESHRVDKLPTSDLISKLCQDDEGPWSTYHRDKSITPRQLGGMLKKFGIQSRTTKFNGSSLKGYFLEDFAGAFARYLPPSGAPGYLPSPRNPAPEPMPAMASAVTDQTELTRNAIPLTGNLSEDVDF
jgi:putative DNA primase/helicase